MGTIEGIVANIPFIWKNADSLLSNQELYNGSRECDELFSDLVHCLSHSSNGLIKDSIVINGDSEEVQKSFGEHEEKETFERPTELDVTSMDSFQETSSVGTALLNNGDAISKTVSQPFNDSADVTEIPHETVVLAHNPSLKKKLDSRRQRKHQRSASDFVETFEDETLPPETNFDDAEPVPLDPIVHPPEEQHLFLIAEPHQQPEFKSIPHQRMLKRVTDVSPLHERVAPNLASKNLLVKVVKADFIDLKSSSDAYCVVELDEPYQRHATHVVPPSEQLFWDQHLLFGLNSNSKRAAFEVFELSKRRKSISRGYAEVYLPDLLTSMVGGGSSELLRCISLDPKQHSSSTSGLLGGPGSGPSGGVGGGAWEFVSSSASSSTSLTIRKPTVTVEFHFMERIVDDPFSVCKGRSGIGSPVPHSKLRVAAPASSSDSSLSQTASGTASSDSGTTAAPTMPAAVTNVSEDRSPQGSKGTCHLRRAVTFNVGQREKVSSGIGQSEAETPKDMTPTPNTDDNTLTSGQHESRLQRSTSTRGSRLFEPAYENLRIADTNAAALYARQHGKGFRRKSSLPRVLSSLGAGMGGSTTSSGFGLLGPSSQLAGVVAGLTAASVESSDASVDPSTAAAVASAVAVAAATGRSSSASIAVDRRGLGSAVGCSGTSGGMADSLFEGTGSSLATLGHPEHEPLGDTVVRYAAPAANVAESLGTYSAQPPLKRPDAAGTKLMNLFRPKRKQRPSGMARLLYLQNLEGSEFDAISTEGYQRIVHGDRTEKQ
ncbi:hypothetical protein Aperf_G00000063873 [Anoplocephala perfoliata]